MNDVAYIYLPVKDLEPLLKAIYDRVDELEYKLLHINGEDLSNEYSCLKDARERIIKTLEKYNSHIN